jgi:hypothetical protein
VRRQAEHVMPPDYASIICSLPHIPGQDIATNHVRGTAARVTHLSAHLRLRARFTLSHCRWSGAGTPSACRMSHSPPRPRR